MAEFSVAIMMLQYVAGFVLLRHPQGEWFLAKQCIDPEKRKIFKTLPVHCTGTLYRYTVTVLQRCIPLM